MDSLPAEDFIKRFVSAYGESWNEVFGELTNEKPCAQHMAEFIDDIEARGQQTPVYIDETGCVSEGNKIVLASYVLDKDIYFKFGEAPDLDPTNLYVVEFDIDSGNPNYLYQHTPDFLSFRMGPDWVYPIDAGVEADEFYAVMYVPSGDTVAGLMEPVIIDRVSALAGVEPISYHLSEVDLSEVDDDGSEW